MAGQAPTDTSRKYASGRRAVGHLLTDAPVELIHAAGFFPVQILSHHGSSGVGSEHFQSFVCSYGRGSVDIALDGSLSFLEGVVVPFICDTTRCVDIVLRDRKPFKFIEAYRLPKSQTGPGSRDYLIGEIKRLKGSLEGVGGRAVTEQVLRRSIALYNRARAFLRRIEPLRAEDPQAYFDICRAYTALPVEVFIELMGKASSDIGAIGSRGEASFAPTPAEPGPGPDGGKKVVDIMLAGKIPEPFDLPETLNSMGVRIVADDLAIGARLFTLNADENGDPIEALADRQLKQIPFAGLLQPIEERPDYLVRRVRETGAQGVIVLVLKFCEIFELDAPELRERLSREKIPALILEIDMVEAVTGPMRTRIEAFLEMIRYG